MSDVHYLRVFKDAKGEWRWHELSSSDLIAESGEGYKNFEDCYEQASKHAPEGVEIHVDKE